MVLTVSSLNFFPVKGGRGISLEHMGLEPRGPVGDRRWLITDETGKFITQRDCGALARLVATPVGRRIAVGIPRGCGRDGSVPSWRRTRQSHDLG